VDYYLLTASGEQAGPYSLDQVRSLWESGKITLDTPYWSQGLSEWQPIRKLESLFRPQLLALPSSAIPMGSPTLDLVGLSAYYQQEFQKIHSSGETYRGKWNWAAFHLSGFWALIKGLWLSLVICLVIGVIAGSVTCGVGSLIAGIIYMFVYGARGNYMYYCAYVKRRQIPF